MIVAETIHDNRRSRRIDAGAAILSYVPFTSRKTRATAVSALNCSRGGLCFQSPRSLKPGQTICVSIQPAVRTVRPEQARAFIKAFALAEVCWCRPDGDPTAGYSIGVRYI